jgi:hypothetical protein
VASSRLAISLRQLRLAEATVAYLWRNIRRVDVGYPGRTAAVGVPRFTPPLAATRTAIHLCRPPTGSRPPRGHSDIEQSTALNWVRRLNSGIPPMDLPCWLTLFLWTMRLGSRLRSRCLRQLLGHLSPHPLHGATAASDQRRHFQDAIPGAQMPPDGVLDLRWHLRAAELLPLLAHAVETGKDTLLRMICRSCSPNTDAIWIIARPIGVVLSIAC